MTSNMEFRLILTNNANTIIENNQKIACGNCSNIKPLLDQNRFGSNPYLFKDVNDNSLKYENSDLKNSYLKKFMYYVKKHTPVINYLF